MANKNTRRARKLGLSNWPETTDGTGVGRRIIERHAEKIKKGIAVKFPRHKAK